MSQGYRTRTGWTTAMAPAANEPDAEPAMAWAWAIVFIGAAIAIAVLAWFEAFRP